MATDPVDALPSSKRRDGHLRTACPADAGDLRAPARPRRVADRALPPLAATALVSSWNAPKRLPRPLPLRPDERASRLTFRRRPLGTSSERCFRPGTDDRNPRPMQARGDWRAGRLEFVLSRRLVHLTRGGGALGEIRRRSCVLSVGSEHPYAASMSGFTALRGIRPRPLSGRVAGSLQIRSSAHSTWERFVVSRPGAVEVSAASRAVGGIERVTPLGGPGPGSADVVLGTRHGVGGGHEQFDCGSGGGVRCG